MIRLIKKINNNFALAQDSGGETIIVEGKGIGFVKMPAVMDDYSMISRTYYNFDEKYLGLLKEIPTEIIDIANMINDRAARKLRCNLNPNLPFILADHINFAITRLQKRIEFTFPMYRELAYMYPEECEIASYALRMIWQKTGVSFPEDEKAGIILNIINAEMDVRTLSGSRDFQRWLDEFVDIIEDNMQIKVSRESFNYSRFVTHLNYLYKRVKEERKKADSQNVEMYETLAAQYTKANICVEKFCEYLKKNDGIEINKEEKLYLILHVNRLCDRELGL